MAAATRDDELAAPALGISLFSSRYAAWLASIALIAFGGALRAQSLGTVNPKQFTLDAGTYRAWVLMELPVGEASKALLERLKQQEAIVTRIRAGAA